MKYAWIAAHSHEFEVEVLCSLLEVGKSGFYASQTRPPSARRIRQDKLLVKIKTVHARSRRIYGSARVYPELLAQGERLSENTVARLMNRAAIRSKIVKRFRAADDELQA